MANGCTQPGVIAHYAAEARSIASAGGKNWSFTRSGASDQGQR
jgi:hypothetical protein